jgi:hypothetical protein
MHRSNIRTLAALARRSARVIVFGFTSDVICRTTVHRHAAIPRPPRPSSFVIASVRRARALAGSLLLVRRARATTGAPCASRRTANAPPLTKCIAAAHQVHRRSSLACAPTVADRSRRRPPAASGKRMNEFADDAMRDDAATSPIATPILTTDREPPTLTPPNMSPMFDAHIMSPHITLSPPCSHDGATGAAPTITHDTPTDSGSAPTDDGAALGQSAHRRLEAARRYIE